MSFVFHKRPFMIIEAMNLYYRYVNKDSYDDLAKNLKLKYQINDDYADVLLKTLQDISDEVMYELREDEEKLSFYFEKFSDEQELSCAHVILYAYFDYDIQDLQKQNEITQKAYQKEGTAGIIAGFMINYLPDETMRSLMNIKESQFMNWLDDNEFSSDVKWKLAKILINYESYRKELNDMLARCIPLLETKLLRIQPYLDDFIKQWQPHLTNDNIKQVIKDNFKINLQDQDKDIIIYPGIMALNHFSYILKEVNNVNHIYLMWGISFMKTFKQDDSRMSKTTSLANLKLLSDPSKFDILSMIKENSAYGQQIAKELNLTTATISHHMQALLNARLIKVDKKQNRLYYRMDRKKVKEVLDEIDNRLLK